jgi:hypothetical protein
MAVADPSRMECGSAATNQRRYAMCSALRRAAITALIIAFLAPGLSHARPFDWVAQNHSSTSAMSREGGFFSMVYNLLANIVTGRFCVSHVGPTSVAKDTINGLTQTQTDPPPPDNGGHLDPNG